MLDVAGADRAEISHVLLKPEHRLIVGQVIPLPFSSVAVFHVGANAGDVMGAGGVKESVLLVIRLPKV